MKKAWPVVLILVASIFTGCSKDDDDNNSGGGGGGGGTPTCETTGVTYTNTVKAIFDANCTSAGCHNSGSANGNGSLANYNDAKAFVAKGRILGAIKRQSGFSAMPQGAGKLSDCNISQIEAWINAGTPN